MDDLGTWIVRGALVGLYATLANITSIMLHIPGAEWVAVIPGGAMAGLAAWLACQLPWWGK